MLEKSLAVLKERESFCKSILKDIPAHLEKFQGYGRVEEDENGNKHIFSGGAENIELFLNQQVECDAFLKDCQKGISEINSLNQTGEGDIGFLKTTISDMFQKIIDNTKESINEYQKLDIPDYKKQTAIDATENFLRQLNDAAIEIFFLQQPQTA